MRMTLASSALQPFLSLSPCQAQGEAVQTGLSDLAKKNTGLLGWWLIPVTLVTWKAEIRRITI
jgi:hypothetical protein